MAQGNDISAGEIARLLNGQAETLARVLLPAGVMAGGFYSVGSVRGEAGDSLKIRVRGNKPGTWADYSLSSSDPEGKGDMLTLVKLTVGEGDIGKAVRWAKGWLGIESLDPAVLERQRRRANEAAAKAEERRARDDEKRRLRARGMWMHGAPLLGSPAMEYLRGRGIDFAALGRLPGAIRFHPSVFHPELGRTVPAMVTAGMMPDGMHRTTHVTYLDRTAAGLWTKLPPFEHVDPKTGEVEMRSEAKKTFGPRMGHHYPIHRGASGKRLRDMPPGEPVYVSEGLEDALTCAMIDPARRVLMAGTLGNTGQLLVPPQAGDLIVLAQRDAPDSPAARSLEAQIAAQQARAASDGSGRRVLCLWPGEGFKDLNDELLGKRMERAA